MLTILQANSLNETKKIAENIANNVKIGDVITIQGTLGVGKTYFANCFINHILKKNNLKKIDIQSPTFSIVKEYPIKNYSIFHFDLYRLKNFNELYELDIENAFENNISLIEWPEIAENIIYNIKIKINIELQNNSRIFNIKYL